jgi:hypothetical protein
MMMLSIVTKGFCRSCDGFTGRIPGDLVDIKEVAHNWVQRGGVHIHPVVKPYDVEERRRRPKAQPVIQRGDDEELQRRRKVFLLNHSAE